MDRRKMVGCSHQCTLVVRGRRATQTISPRVDFIWSMLLQLGLRQNGQTSGREEFVKKGLVRQYLCATKGGSSVTRSQGVCAGQVRQGEQRLHRGIAESKTWQSHETFLCDSLVHISGSSLMIVVLENPQVLKVADSIGTESVEGFF